MNVNFLICGNQMKKFLKKGSFNNFQILAAFLIPTIVYLIFSVDWTDRFNRNKKVINCRNWANASIAEGIKRGDKGLLTRKQQKKQYEVEMNFCLINLPKILEKNGKINTMEKYMKSLGLKYVK